MGKNHRHKKDLKAEKAKVKLKQTKTKFLPKGQNVTNATFKIKPIVVQEQLKRKSFDEVLSKRKLNAKDLLSRIKHYNDNVRHVACEELSDMVRIHTEEIIQQHLSQICLAISLLMQDKEQKVRKAAAKSIKVILGHVPNEKLIPFFDYFSTNLRCAMTNIDKSIQEDSLMFLDCFINSNCNLLTKASEKLLPDFLSLISKLRSDSQLGRTLTLNLGSKMTSVAWRIKVLSRLHAVLNMILHKEKNTCDDIKDLNTFKVSGRNTFPLYKDRFVKSLEEPALDIFSNMNNSTYSGLDNINKHVLTLVPLLYETWLEVMPEQAVQKSSSESFVLSEDMASLLGCITNTLYLLWQYVKQIESEEINLKSVFLSSEGQKFLKHLLNNFPYCYTGGRVSKKSKIGTLQILEHNNDPKCVYENLLICFLYLMLYINCTQHHIKKEANLIVTYITKIYFQKGFFNEHGMRSLTELLSECFTKNQQQKWQKAGVDVPMLLTNTVLFYNHGKINEQNRLALFKILSKVIDNEQLSQNDQYQSWLANLPRLLCEEFISDSTIEVLLELSKKKCDSFDKGLARKLVNILENLERLKITLTSDSMLRNEQAALRNLSYIFYFAINFTSNDLKYFQQFISTSSSPFKPIIEEMVNSKCNILKHSC